MITTMKRIFSASFNRLWTLLSSPSWTYRPLNSGDDTTVSYSSRKRAICGTKLPLFNLSKNPRRVLVVLSSLVLLSVIALLLTRSRPGIIYEPMTEDGTCELPPWKNITKSLAQLDIVPGKTFVRIVRDPETGEQLIDVDCGGSDSDDSSGEYQYHFPSMHSWFGRFENWNQRTQGRLKFREEYVMIRCTDSGESNFLTRDPIKEQTWEPRFQLPETSSLINQQPMVDDIVILILDAVSREHFNEACPKTIGLLENLQNLTTQSHETFSFTRYNVLGTNSPPNKAFIYSGQSVERLTSKKGRRRASWLWDIYEAQGFSTMHSDGECGGWWEWPFTGYADGSITYYYEKSRDAMPAQHQFPHVAICDNYRLFRNDEFGRTCKLLQGNDDDYNEFILDGMIVPSPPCMGQKAVYDTQFDYMRQFLSVYNGSDQNGNRYKRFTTVTVMDTHSHSNNLVKFDDSMVDLLTDLLVGGRDGQPPLLQPNSAVFVLSDHGIHYGKEYATYEGYIHHKQPPLHMILPKTLADTYRSGILTNLGKLTTHMDLHQTLLYLAFGQGKDKLNPVDAALALKDPHNLFENGEHGHHHHGSRSQEYGEVLLLPITEVRTCHNVGIPTEFCPCVKYTELNTTLAEDLTIITSTIQLGVDYMNNQITSRGVENVCQLFEYHSSTNISTFGEFKDLAYSAGYYLPSSDPNSRIFSVTVNVKSYPAQLKLTAIYDDILAANRDKIEVIQTSSYKDEWEGICRERIRKEVENGDAKVAEGERLLKHFCFCSRKF